MTVSTEFSYLEGMTDLSIRYEVKYKQIRVHVFHVLDILDKQGIQTTGFLIS